MCILLCSSFGYAQYWKAIGRGVAPGLTVGILYGDPVFDRLLAGGNFTFIFNEEDTVLGASQASWNGERWDSLAHRVQAGNNSTSQPTSWFYRFQGDLYCAGAFAFSIAPGEVNSAFARLNEDTERWEALECLNPMFGGMQYLVPPSNDTHLYVTGQRGSICGYPESCVFLYDGEEFHEWEPFQQIPYHNGNMVGLMFDFQGMTYMSGSFRDPYSDEFVALMRYNGTEWEYVPGWNANQTIKCFNIHNDMLYIGGTFRQSQGAPGNYIAMYDGETWSDMGGGLAFPNNPNTGVVWDMGWFQDELWVSGHFLMAGGGPTNSIAKWNGQQWCGLPGDFLLPNGFQVSSISGIGVWRDSLYVCGSFMTIDGDTIRNVAQWMGGDYSTNCSDPIGVGVEELASVPQLRVSPNPARTHISLEGHGMERYSVEITDVLGKRILYREVHRGPLDIQRLPPGSFHVTLTEHESRKKVVARFVKE
jgi:hypothetical protein